MTHISTFSPMTRAGVFVGHRKCHADTPPDSVWNWDALRASSAPEPEPEPVVVAMGKRQQPKKRVKKVVKVTTSVRASDVMYKRD